MCQLFWGLFLLLMGASIVLNIVLGINVPIFKMFLAGFLIYMGVRILMPSTRTSFSWSCFSSSNDSCLFEKTSIESDFYELRFGKSTVDLGSLSNLTEPKTIRIEVQFADATVILPAGIPVHVKADVSFGAVHLPGKPLNSEYVNLHGAVEPLLTVLIESAFSSVTVKE
jgi:predicted membrane protein